MFALHQMWGQVTPTEWRPDPGADRRVLTPRLEDDPRLAGRTHDLSYRRASGEMGWAIASGRPMQGDDGSPAGMLLMLTDITERKNAELALAAVQVDLGARIRIRSADLSHINAPLREQVAVREAAERALAASEERLHEIISAMLGAAALFRPARDARTARGAGRQREHFQFARRRHPGRDPVAPARRAGAGGAETRGQRAADGDADLVTVMGTVPERPSLKKRAGKARFS